MKLIFLDLDGVANSGLFFRKHPPDARLEMGKDTWWTEMLDPDAIEHLNHIIAETGAKVVISSTWRLAQTMPELQRRLEMKGFKGEIVGETPRGRSLIGSGTSRGKEIAAWLAATDLDVEAFVILDDDGDMEPLMRRLVQTEWECGLRAEHADRAIEMLMS